LLEARQVFGPPRLSAAVPGRPACSTSAAGGGPEWHAHAFLWRDGVCIGVHVSKADPDREDAARLDAILSSVRLAEDL
jgi:hypothetical protein